MTAQTAKHTQGKWTIRGPVYGGPSNFEQNVGTDSTCTAIACGTSRHELEANAALIAAAPDLLAELQWAENTLRHAAQESAGRVKAEIVGGWIHHADRCRAAIARLESRADA